MKITEKEIEAVSKLDSFARYKYFIKRVADTEKMYSLIDEGGNYALADVESRTVISLWSASEFALMNVIEEWSCYKVKEITLEEFEDNLIDEIEKREWLLNVFSVKGKSGFVVDINEFANDLSDELNKY